MYEDKTREQLIEEINSLKNELEKQNPSHDLIKQNIDVFSSLFDHTKDLIYIKDTDLRFRYINPYLLHFFGIKERDVIGKTNHQLMSEERAIEYDIEEKLVLKGEISRTEETREVENHQRTFYTVRSPMYDSEENLIGICGISREITKIEETLEALHESQQKLLGILQSTNVGINLYDLNGKVLFVNSALIEMLGYTREEFENLKLDQITHPDDLKESIINIYKVLDGEVENYEFDERYIRKDGSTFWGNLSLAPIKNSEGIIEGLISIVVDASERKLAEQKILDSENKLREANSTKDKFFSIIAHDLRNPLGSLMNLTNMFATDYDEMDDEEKIQSVEYLESASKTAYELLENLLNWSRAQTGKMEIEKKIYSIEKIIETNIQLTKPLAENKSINIIFAVVPGLNIFADENMTTTVIRNLLTNAIKFTEISGNITITAHQTSDDYCTVTVKDDGIGISDENIQKLFRIDTNHKTLGTSKEKGTGLGLILCKEFVKLNGGKLWVESKLGEGSSFKFTIPLKSN